MPVVRQTLSQLSFKKASHVPSAPVANGAVRYVLASEGLDRRLHATHGHHRK